MAIPYIIGLSLGIPLTWRYSRFRDNSLPYRLGVGLLVSVGIAITINASLELLDLVGFATDGRNVTTSGGNQPINSAEVASEIPTETKQQKTWEQEQHYADGILKATRTVTRDASGEIVPHGPASTYHPNGKLKWTATFELGKQVGAWQEYYAEGTKEGEGDIFDDGNAEEKHWHENGELKSEGKWRHGVKHGLWKTWYASGQLAGELHYEAGKLHGTVREWHLNGKRKLDAEFLKGLPASPLKRWNEQGELVEPSTE